MHFSHLVLSEASVTELLMCILIIWTIIITAPIYQSNTVFPIGGSVYSRNHKTA